MRVVIYHQADLSVSVGLESDEGTHGELLASFPATPRGELSADNCAYGWGDRLDVPVYLVCQDGHLMLVQRVKAERKLMDWPGQERTARVKL